MRAKVVLLGEAVEFWNRLKSLLARAAGKARHAFGSTGGSLRPVFGTFTWTPPEWVPALAVAIRRRRHELAMGGGAAFAILLTGWLGMEWYLHRPHPPEPLRITFQAQDPAVTDYEKPDGTPAVIVHPVDVHFSASTAHRIGAAARR